MLYVCLRLSGGAGWCSSTIPSFSDFPAVLLPLGYCHHCSMERNELEQHLLSYLILKPPAAILCSVHL